MFIQTQLTPNPQTIKFLPGVPLMPAGQTCSVKTVEEGKHAPLAQALLAVDGVEEVFLATEFLSVRAREGVDWMVLKPLVLSALMEHLIAERPIYLGDVASLPPVVGKPDTLDGRIRELLETRVRPAVAADGGDISFERFENGIVYVRLEGACSGCPSSTLTLKNGIENLLRHYVPEVTEVRSIEEESHVNSFS